VDVAYPFLKQIPEIDVLVAINYFSKWSEVYVIPNQKAATVREVRMENFYRFEVTIDFHYD